MEIKNGWTKKRHATNGVPTNRKRAAYIRVSTYLQSETGNGLEMQRNAILAFSLTTRDENIDTWYVDIESGAEEERADLQRLRADINIGNIESLTVYKLDRLSREMGLHEAIIREMRENETEFYSVNEKFEKSPYGTAFRQILAVFAQLERAMIMLRLSDGKKTAISRKGTWGGGIAPYGFKPCGGRIFDEQGQVVDNQPGRGLLESVEEEQELVRVVYRLRAQNIGSCKIAAWLNANGYRCRDGKEWYYGLVESILGREAFYRGTAVIHNIMVPEPKAIAHAAVLTNDDPSAAGIKARRNIYISDEGQICEKAFIKVPPDMTIDYVKTIERAEALATECDNSHQLATRLNREGHMAPSGKKFWSNTAQSLVDNAITWRKVLSGEIASPRVLRTPERNRGLQDWEMEAGRRGVELYASGDYSYRAVAALLDSEFPHPYREWYASEIHRMVQGKHKYKGLVDG